MDLKWNTKLVLLWLACSWSSFIQRDPQFNPRLLHSGHILLSLPNLIRPVKRVFLWYAKPFATPKEWKRESNSRKSLLTKCPFFISWKSWSDRHISVWRNRRVIGFAKNKLLCALSGDTLKVATTFNKEILVVGILETKKKEITRSKRFLSKNLEHKFKSCVEITQSFTHSGEIQLFK